MIEIRDNGTLRGSRQSGSIDAVGVALGNKMALTLLMSGTWGGDAVGFQRAFEKMVANWKLSSDKGPVWDPMHPPSPMGARSGLYFGSRVDNQLNPLGGMDLTAQREYLVLLPRNAHGFLTPVEPIGFKATRLTLPGAENTEW
jgi:hypothetical protein